MSWLKGAAIGLKGFRWWRKNEIGKRILGKPLEREQTSEGIEYDTTETTTMGKYLKSRTIQGLLASGVAGGLGLLIGDAEAAELAPQAAEWVLNGLQLAGLVWAAYGRKLAQGPL